MAKVIIEVEDRILANILALWFESGNGIEALKDWAEYDVVDKLAIPELDLYPSVIFDADDDGESDDIEHTVILNFITEWTK